MIKAILFDFGQTLVDSADGFRSAEKEAQKKIFPDFTMASRDDFLTNYRRIRKEFQENSNFSRKAIWNAVYRHYNLDPGPDRLERWEDEYWEQVKAKTNIFPETKQVLEILGAAYRLALITNTQGQKTYGTHRLSQFPELEKFFEVIILAGEFGIPPKPHPIPFRKCLEKMEISPEEAVYVGDDWRIDICGAKDIGIHPIWLQHFSVSRNWPQVETSVPIITNLDRLLDLEQILS